MTSRQKLGLFILFSRPWNVWAKFSLNKSWNEQQWILNQILSHSLAKNEWAFMVFNKVLVGQEHQEIVQGLDVQSIKESMLWISIQLSIYHDISNKVIGYSYYAINTKTMFLVCCILQISPFQCTCGDKERYTMN